MITADASELSSSALLSCSDPRSAPSVYRRLFIMSLSYQVIPFTVFFFFFLMIRPPPRSPLFPYPTPFRSLDDAAGRRGPARRVPHPHDRGASDRRARHTGPSGGVSRGALPALRRWKDHAVLLGLGPERQHGDPTAAFRAALTRPHFR